MKDSVDFVDLSSQEPRSFSWMQIRQIVDKVQAAILKKNLPAQSRIAIVGKNSIEYFISIMAIRASGHVAVPLSYKFPSKKLLSFFNELQVPLVISENRQILGAYPAEHLSFYDKAFGFSDNQVITKTDLHLSSARLSLMIFSSGSSGEQKKILLSEKSRRSFLVASALQREDQIGARPRTLVATPFSHILANNILESVFAKKESVVLLPKFETTSFIQAIEKYSVNRLSLVPSMWSLLLQDEQILKVADLSSVRHIYFSSEPLNESLIQSAKQYFPNATIENCYGISEAGPNLFGPHPAGLPRPDLSVGYPRPGILYKFVKDELYIKTPFMMSGYENQSTLAAEAFSEDGYFRTRDRFYVDENGFYFHIGRADDLIIQAGVNIYPAEIEAIICRHSDVLSCAVVKIADKLKHESAFAMIVVKKDKLISENELVSYMLEQGPKHLVPKKFWFVEELPIGANLKVDKEKIRQLISQWL